MRGLIEGVIYEFRVKTVDKAGESEPSEPSLPHRARPKNSAPRIDRNAMMDIKIHSEGPLLLDIPVDGEPLPMKRFTCASIGSKTMKANNTFIFTGQ